MVGMQEMQEQFPVTYFAKTGLARFFYAS